MNQTIQTSLARITHKSFTKGKPFEVIFAGLNGKNAVSTKSFLYHFKNVEIFNFSEKVIYGELYKSKLSSEHDVLDMINLTYQPAILNELHSMNKFVIFTDLSIVFTSKSKFKDDEFIHYFEKLYQLNSIELFHKLKLIIEKRTLTFLRK